MPWPQLKAKITRKTQNGHWENLLCDGVSRKDLPPQQLQADTILNILLYSFAFRFIESTLHTVK